MNKFPTVVLFGRMNVGKSTLFNRLAERGASLVMDYAGVTRDFLTAPSRWRGVPFTVVDTGGVSVHKVADPLVEQVRKRALAQAEKADIILLVVDGTVGVTLQDQELVKWLHKSGRSVFVVVNKSDVAASVERLSEFNRLGFKDVFIISAVHGTGLSELQDALVARLPRKQAQEVDQVPMRVTLLGKPNVGKSSLMNVLLKQERSIVSDVAGTTREAVREPLQFYSQALELIDTAGVRRKRSVDAPIEELMVKSSLQAVRESDVILLVIDAAQGPLSDQELKLAFYVFEQGKALIIVRNKIDLIEEYAAQQWQAHVREYSFFYDKIEIRAISCKSGKNIGQLLPLIQEVWQRYRTQMDNDELTHVCKQALVHTPLYRAGHAMRFYAVKQVKVRPPTIQVIVAEPRLIGEREFAFLDRVIRQKFQLRSVPLVWADPISSDR